MDLSTSSYILIVACLLAMLLHALHVSRKRTFLLLDPLNVFWGGFIVVYIFQAFEQGAFLIEHHPRETLEWSLIWVFASVLAPIWAGWAM